MTETKDTRTLRAEDRMRRAWAQLLREMSAEGLTLPLGADIRIREDNGDLTAEAVLLEGREVPPISGETEDAPPRISRKPGSR
jgi:hypothetical protein